MKPSFDPGTTSVRIVEAEGFREGSNGVAPDTGKQEIEASFERRKAEVREESTCEIKALEARAQTLVDLSQEAQARWKAIQQNHANDVPRLLMPLLWLP